MSSHAYKTTKIKNQSSSNVSSQKQRDCDSTFQLKSNRSKSIAQRQLQDMADNSPHVAQLRSINDITDNSPQFEQSAQLQTMADKHSTQQQQSPIQKKENNTGLPDNLKTGVENLSGISLDDVKVHHNSSKPSQLQAHAYAQGTDIHLGSGQEKHLPHEAWHVVQQKQGRVKPTLQMKGNTNINNDIGLEREADAMGAKALHTDTKLSSLQKGTPSTSNVKQLMPMAREVYGITHLVKMVNGHIYAEDYKSNEGQQVSEGDRVTIESNSKIMSRRGPNQEVEKNNTDDKKSTGNYAWYLVTNLNGLDHSGKNLYIREDTIRIPSKMKSKAGSKIDRADNTMEVADNTNSLVDLFRAQTNYGDHAKDGGTSSTKSFADHFKRGKGTDAKSNNNAWGSAGTSVTGGVLSGLGAISSVGQGLYGLKDTKKNYKEFKEGDRWERAEMAGSALETTAGMTSSVMGAVNSINNAAGSIGGAGHWNSSIGTFGGEAIPVASTVMGGLGMIKNGYQIGKNCNNSKALNNIENDKENHSEEARKVASYGAKTADKRANRAGVHLAANTLSTAGGAASLSGVGVGVGIVLGAASSTIKFGAMGARMLKQRLRDKRAKKGEKESYATWKARQKDKISKTKNPIKKAKYKALIKTTMNWDKTTANKDAERADMAQSLVNLAKKGGRDLDDAIKILKNIGGNKAQIEKLSTLYKPKSDAEAKKLKVEIETLFQKRE